MMAGNNVISKVACLTDKYPCTFSDFHGHGTPCIYKSGPEWPAQGSLGKPLVHEPHPVYGHAIQPTWVSISTCICDKLESDGIMWTFINPFTYANAGECKPFCPLIICVSVNPGSIPHEVTVAGAAVIKNILTNAGFPDIKVAFIKLVMAHSMGPRLLSFNPLVNKVPNLHKPFTPTLGLSIASYKYLYYEGTHALYVCLPGGNDHVTVLTCTHVTHPPPVHANTGMT
ncbi:hypothetical protein FRC11_013329 [Ceratobasidium sp. 423]|nr:hypothetical protein FRC11_013329 [Ceratobasidium sp. 423]